MSEILHLTNFDSLNLLERTELDDVAEAGQATVKVRNTDGLNANDYVIVGHRGEEDAELKQIQSINSSTRVITLTTNLLLDHNELDPLVSLRGNQIKVYRAANVDDTVPADASFSVIATKTIEADQDYTEYADAGGGEDYWYKKTYYNATTTAATALSTSPATRGGNHGHVIDLYDIREEAGFVNNEKITDSMISIRRTMAESEALGAIARRYTLPLSYNPPVIINAIKLLAAGYLLLSTYGVGEEGTSKEGVAKVKLAKDLLKQIANGEIPLLGLDQVELTGVGGELDGYPGEDAAELYPNTGRKFSMQDEY